MPKRREKLTDKKVAKLVRKEKRYAYPDPELRGHWLRIPPHTSEAPISYVVVARDPGGKQIWKTIGTADRLTIAQAREEAKSVLGHIEGGGPAVEPPKPARPTVGSVAQQWLDLHVWENGFRTASESERIINTHIVPHLGDQAIDDVRKEDLTKLLDLVRRENGRHMADGVLKVFSSFSRWHETRVSDFRPLLTRGMHRVLKGEGRRKRALGDDELRAIWGTPGQYGDFCRLALLTGQRRDKLHTLRWDDLDANGVWSIRTAPREKGNPGKLKLAKVALDIIQAQSRFVGNPYVFAGQRGNGPAAAFGAGQYKAKFDKLCGVKNWRIHDLRRTARSLMARAGVQTEIAERVLGHAQGELIEIYDRHDYQIEMGLALEKLAALIELIINPRSENVVAIKQTTSA
jgi:integrase